MQWLRKKVAIGIGSNVEVARYGAILHDIGKAHPKFPKAIGQGATEFEIYLSDMKSHLACLFPYFDKTIQPSLIDMVIAHHKFYEEMREKGFFDLTEEQ